MRDTGKRESRRAHLECRHGLVSVVIAAELRDVNRRTCRRALSAWALIDREQPFRVPFHFPEIKSVTGGNQSSSLSSEGSQAWAWALISKERSTGVLAAPRSYPPFPLSFIVSELCGRDKGDTRGMPRVTVATIHPVNKLEGFKGGC